MQGACLGLVPLAIFAYVCRLWHTKYNIRNSDIFVKSFEKFILGRIWQRWEARYHRYGWLRAKARITGLMPAQPELGWSHNE